MKTVISISMLSTKVRRRNGVTFIFLQGYVVFCLSLIYILWIIMIKNFQKTRMFSEQEGVLPEFPDTILYTKR